MTKTELVKIVAEKTNKTIKEVKEVIDVALGAIGNSLDTGEDVIIKDFGTFFERTMKERVGRNPNTGEKLTIPEKKVVRFKAHSKIKFYSKIKNV
jgi:nucleoid DNA-binding protein